MSTKYQYNFLTENLPEPPKHPLIVWLLRLAFIGFCASIISDTVSNSLRVVKTYRQVNDTKVSYSKCCSLPLLQLQNADNHTHSRGRQAGCPARWTSGSLRPWPQDKDHRKWSAGDIILDPVEAFPGLVSQST